jgi:citrate lyase subunit beta/citryl-CoA lyase
MRSFLFVPADSERKLAKGPSSGPDGLILDLEDSVAADRKKTARDMALAYLRSANRAGPRLYVRVNALDTGLTLGDLAVVMQGRPDGIVFPKCVGQANLDLLANYLDAREAREGIDAGTTKILTIATESAAAVLALTAAPARHARLMGHSWGGEDLMADLGALAKGPAPGVYDDTFRLARTVNLMASVAAGVPPMTRSIPASGPAGVARRGERRTTYGLRRQDRHPSRPGRRHPRGLHAIGAGDRVGPARRRHLRGQPASGVLTLDGKMLDRPHLVLARRLLARAGG